MQTLALLARSRWVNFSMNILLASAWSVFVWNHLRSFNITGDYALIAFALSETLQVLFFLIRRSPLSVSLDPFDWLVAGGGTLAPPFFFSLPARVWGGGAGVVLLCG